MEEAQPHPFEPTFFLKEYSEQDCLSAIRGEKIPSALGYTITRLCVIRGIRYHTGFATELHGSSYAAFTRALNARCIMSNEGIPDLSREKEFPYCIWHPAVPSEETCRELLRKYPQMKYHVGRVCAVAGYVDLFHELDLLPEVHIAEEARDNGHTAIFDAIMKNPVKYTVMNDYFRRLEEAPRVSSLNDDTAVRSSLEIKQKFGPPLRTGESSRYFGECSHDASHYFNITEDCRVDEFASKKKGERDSKDTVALLYTPLPADLPAGVNKDLLIMMAAYYGDVDRYARLRRPYELCGEFQCVIHGIYTHTMFAKWWSLQVPPPEEIPDSEPDDDDEEEEEDDDDDDEEPWYTYKLSLTRSINRAITARFIMSNDLSRVTQKIYSDHFPYTIWHPLVPLEETLAELIRRRPDLKPQAARACIVGDYQQLYAQIDPDVDRGLLEEARLSRNLYYQEDLEKKLKAGRGEDTLHDSRDPWRALTHTSLRLGTVDIRPNVSEQDVGSEFDSIYEGTLADPSRVELHVCVPDELKVDPPEYLRLWGT